MENSFESFYACSTVFLKRQTNVTNHMFLCVYEQLNWNNLSFACYELQEQRWYRKFSILFADLLDFCSIFFTTASRFNSLMIILFRTECYCFHQIMKALMEMQIQCVIM